MISSSINIIMAIIIITTITIIMIITIITTTTCPDHLMAQGREHTFGQKDRSRGDLFC